MNGPSHNPTSAQGKEDMAMLVAALKKALGVWGWTEAVRREPRSLLLQVQRPRAGGAKEAAREVGGDGVCVCGGRGRLHDLRSETLALDSASAGDAFRLVPRPCDN